MSEEKKKKKRSRSRSKRVKNDDKANADPTAADDDASQEEKQKQNRRLVVIAPEQPDGRNRQKQKQGKTADEAVDDLDLDLDNLIEGPEPDNVLASTTNTDGAQDTTTTTSTTTSSTTSTPSLCSPQDLVRARALAQKPLPDVARQWKLADFLVDNLQEQGKYQHFFPIQTLVIPHVLLQSRTCGSNYHCRDVCIAAPTGSGKTLAYLIPILQALHETCPPPPSHKHMLRALFVLPSRDLAHQVYQVAKLYASSSSIEVGLAVGGRQSTDVQTEQRALIRTTNTHNNNNTDSDADDANTNNTSRAVTRVFASISRSVEDVESARRCLELDPSNLELALQAYPDGSIDIERKSTSTTTTTTSTSCSSSFCAVDILVCTPGRLVDHLEQGTFSLEHLRYLVVDEADRLLSQRYHNWITKVLQATTNTATTSNSNNKLGTPEEWDECRYRMDPVTWRHSSLLPPQNNAGTTATTSTMDSSSTPTWKVTTTMNHHAGQPVPLQKFLVSATLTRDPQKLAALQLLHPIHFSLSSSSSSQGVDNKRYSLPPELTEYTVECTAEQKPLILLALLLERLVLTDKKNQKMVLFTSSVDSTHRLARLLQLLWAAGAACGADEKGGAASTIAEFSSASSSLSATERAALLNSPVIVCSDGMSRGMDLTRINYVINYDVPSFAKTYVHRCGRTARAGQSGTAITLLKRGQEAQFHKMRSLILADNDDAVKSTYSNSRHRRSLVESLTVENKALMKEAIPTYRECLKALRRVLQAEENGELSPTEVDRLHEFFDEEPE